MKIVTTTNTWSMECGDDAYYSKGVEYTLRLIFEAEKLNVLAHSNQELSFKHLSNTQIQISGKVIFKDEYLIIVENKVRFGIVLNNRFRFGNHNYVGNKEIDHSDVEVGDIVEVLGYFRFQCLFFCIFTFLPNEFSIPDLDYKWKVNNIYRIADDSWDSKELSELESVEDIDTSSQDIDDAYALEFELQNETPLPFDLGSGIHGPVSSICWVDQRNFVSNCKGIVDEGIKMGKWTYLDKKGQNKREFYYDEP